MNIYATAAMIRVCFQQGNTNPGILILIPKVLRLKTMLCTTNLADYYVVLFIILDSVLNGLYENVCPYKHTYFSTGENSHNSRILLAFFPCISIAKSVISKSLPSRALCIALLDSFVPLECSL